MMDCAVIGGGPAGMNAALVLGRAHVNAVVFDEGKPRNRVTQKSYGYLTQDGVTPAVFRERARKDILKYPTVSLVSDGVIEIEREKTGFQIKTSQGNTYKTKRVLFATGQQDRLPAIKGLSDVYGKSVFSCPFCDGYEMSHQKLAVIAENNHAAHLGKLLSNWSRDVIVYTNGYAITEEDIHSLAKQNIRVNTTPILELASENGQLTSIRLDDGQSMVRDGGIVATELTRPIDFIGQLGCEMTPEGKLILDIQGRTSIPQVYACGEISMPSQLIVAAAEGSRTAAGIVMDIVEERFAMPAQRFV